MSELQSRVTPAPIPAAHLDRFRVSPQHGCVQSGESSGVGLVIRVRSLPQKQLESVRVAQAGHEMAEGEPGKSIKAGWAARKDLNQSGDCV